MDLPKPPTRRGFLEWLIGLCSAVTAAAMVIPGVAYLWPAAKGGGADRVEVPGAAGLAPGQSAKVQVGSQVVIVLRKRSGFAAYSAVCTHLGCLVFWEEKRGEFLCPCHAAVFGDQGQVISGPPPAPLKEFVVREIGEKVYVSAPA
jgi:cytochrome b6-f complex iron-sulfur subunit